MAAVADREAGLLGEIRRNLTVHTSQAPQHPVRAVCVAAGGEQDPLRERLQSSLAVAQLQGEVNQLISAAGASVTTSQALPEARE